ncbi:MAG: CDP-alcohol phosphatidyltransferase family protein [Planctomycetota bacterium]|jgi:CDP-diacylglycerol--serine O-phosphatidyltransferase
MPSTSDRDAVEGLAPEVPAEMAPRGRRRRLPPVSVMPTLCTLGNLVAGFAAIFYASKPEDFVGPWGWSGLWLAGVLVFLGMLLDAVDGWVARLTRSISELGSHLDSLADAVTFGVAPAFMLLQLVGHYLSDAQGRSIIGPEADDVLGKVVWAVAVVYVCCAALRLARFNVEAGPSRIERGSAFRGLPSPGAAGAITSLILLHQYLIVDLFAEDIPTSFARGAALGMPFVALLCGLAMVSSIPYPHLTNRYLYGPRSFGYVARLVVLLALAIWFLWGTLALVFTVYVLSGPVQVLRNRGRPQALQVLNGPNGEDRGAGTEVIDDM